MRLDLHNRRSGFNLIELVIVVVIIAVIGAIAIPKVSRGAPGVNDSALIQELSSMRSALDYYATDHGGTFPSSSSAAGFVDQLTQFTDASGEAQPTRDSTHVYGPYLKCFPNLPVGRNAGVSTITVTGPVGTGNFAWYYDGTTLWANTSTSELDLKGNAYNGY